MGNGRAPVAWLKILVGVAVVASLSLGGCMAAGMHGTCQQVGPQGHGVHAAVVRELRAGEVVLSLEVPSVDMGSEAVLTVRIRRAQDGAPVSGAKVVFAIQPVEPSSAGSVLEYPAEEAAEKGTYQLKHPFADYGRYQITARVWLDEQDQAAPPLVLTATPEVVHQEGGHTPMGLTSMSVAGGIGMVLMMSIMMGRFLF